jgi:NADH:ubiquinone oxidoreductase subunit F (NADH-binding)/(2Fe-2S) ferredoxin
MTEQYQHLQIESQRRWQNLAEGNTPWIRVGTAICGEAAGAKRLLETIRETLRAQERSAQVSEVGCLGLCYAEPLMDIQVPGGPRVFYGNVDPDMVPDIIKRHLGDGIPSGDFAIAYVGDSKLNDVPHLDDLPMMKGQFRIALRNAGHIDPGDIYQYIAQGGYAALDKALSELKPEQVQKQVLDSGLRGRGGAAFPTGTKWSFLSRSSGPTKYILVNCEEGDPGAFNDKGILESDPHQLIEGAILAGYATGSSNCYVFIRHGHDGPIRRTMDAIQEAREVGLVGENILGTDFSFDVDVSLTGDSYVAGEETALMEAVEGKRAMPRFRPPFPAAVGVWGKPSNINNVKTLAYVPQIISHGAEWFSSIGVERSKGTVILCLSGDLKRTGMVEVPLGTNFLKILEEMSGGSRSGKELKLLQTGGPLGGVLDIASADIPLDFEVMAQAGAILGSGGIIVADANACAVDLTRVLVAFCQFESCGKCFPCRLGMSHLVEVLERITRYETRPHDLELMETIGKSMTSGSLCGHGQLGFNPVESALRYFKEDFRVHMEEGRCPTGSCDQPIVTPQRTRP